MKHVNKSITLVVLLALAVSNIILLETAYAAASAPSAPEFTVQYVDHSYDVPTTYGKDPYTGQSKIISNGYHVDNRTIDVTITNQPFTPYLYGNSTVYLYYNIRSKGHYEDWADATGGHSINRLAPSTSTYTVVSFNIQYWDVPQNGEIDFQVQAILSYTVKEYSGSCLTGSTTFTAAESDWSNTKTVRISTASPPTTSPPTWSPDATATPTQPDTQTGVLFDFDWKQTLLIVMAVGIAGFAVVVIVLWRKLASKKASPPAFI